MSDQPLPLLSPRRFFFRVVGVGALLALFQILGMELLIFYLTTPTLPEIWKMATIPGPVVNGLLAAFFVCVYLYLRPLLRFLGKLRRGEEPEADEARRVQDRSVNFPYVLAVLAYPFYMIGGPLGTWLVGRQLGWPTELPIYGFFGGAISVSLTAPLAVYAYHWVAEPVTRLAAQAAPELPAARPAGRRLSASLKLIVSVLCLVGAWTAYTGLVGYHQNQALLENLKKVEAMLPADARATLVDEAAHRRDPAPRSSRYFQERLGNLKVFYLSLLLAALSMALLLAIAAAKEITQPIALLHHAAERVRQGRYGDAVRLIGNDELAELGAALNRMMDTIVGQFQAMAAVVERLRGGILQIEETVRTVHQVSDEQATGATQQAGAVQEASSIAAEIVASARQIENRGRTVDEIAGQTLSACREGSEKLGLAQTGFAAITEQVEAIRGAMRELEHRFREIYQVVELMEEVAEQTELLALNAALEAAGAGEAGRRFMVVAEATQRLAVRAGESTRQIRGLVERIQQATVQTTRLAEGGREKVAGGGEMIAAAAAALQAISGLAESTSASVSEISLSAKQQRTGSEQLAAAVVEVHEVAKKVEAGAKQVQAAVAELAGFAETLRATVEEKGPAPD